MMMALATMTPEGAAAMLFYLVIYLFMNLGAFAVVAMLRNLTHSEDLAYFRGMIYRNPVLVITFAVFILSLLGMPPLAGFAAKFQVFRVLFDGARDFATQGQSGLSYILYALLVIGGLNTVLSLFYYVKVLKVMILDQPLEAVENRPVAQLPTPAIANGYLIVLAGAILVVGILWNPLSVASTKGVIGFTQAPQVGSPQRAEGGAR
jgi:NADH-quinone oxidoreductase subunit N